MANTKVTSNVISDDIALGGNPTTTTQSAGNNTTRIATTAFVKAAIDATIDSAPGALDTLNELAAAIGDDANFSTTITNSIATKLPLAGGTMTGNLTLNGADIVKSGSADLTIDVGGRIDLSADDNGEIRLFDGSSMYAQFKDDSDRLKIQSLISDADMMFVGNDNGSEVTALTLDMSDAGTATFNHDVKLGDDSELVLGDGTDLKFYHSGSVNYIKTNSDLPLKIWDAGGAGILEMTPNGKVGIFHNGSEKIYTTSTGAVIAHNSDTDYSSTGEPAGILTLYNSNGSDGGGVNNYSSLEFNTGDGATSQGFINYVRTADNQGKFTFSQRTGSSSYAEAMTILNDGKVGIGTTSPLSHLTFESDHWNTGTEDGPSIRWNNGITTADSVLQSFEDSNVVPMLLGMNAHIASGGSFASFNSSYASAYVYTGADGSVYLGNAASGTPSNKVRVHPDGNTGIGGNATNAKLEVVATSGEVFRADANNGAYRIVANQDNVMLNGTVLVGTSSAVSNAKLTVDGGDMMVQGANNSAGISDLLPGYTRGDYGVIHSTANHVYFSVGSSYVSYINGGNGTFNVSDQRLKENVTTLTGALDKVKQLRGVSFTWKDTEERGTDTAIGLIAQEVEAVYPQLVDDGGLPKDNDGNDPLKSVNYAHLTSVLIEAIKELSTELDAAKARITTLEG